MEVDGEDERIRSLIKEWLVHDGARTVSPNVPLHRRLKLPLQPL